MLMSRKRNIKKEMFQPTTECVDSLTILDVTGQAVPESGTGRTECSVADGCKLHSRYLQSMCLHYISDESQARSTTSSSSLRSQLGPSRCSTVAP